MRRSLLQISKGAIGCGLLLAAAAPTPAATAAQAYELMGLDPSRVLAGTSYAAKVVPGEGKQFVCVTTYFTGKKQAADAVNVRLDVFQDLGSRLISLYTRDFGEEAGGFVADGELQILDLDRDGVSEIVASFKSYRSPVIVQRHGEVIVYTEDGFRTGWTGPLEYDATKAVREVPEERRDRFEREIDLGRTLGSRGRELHVKKTVIAVAGERLAEPRVVDEVFPLRMP